MQRSLHETLMFPRESAEQDRRFFPLLAGEGSGTVGPIVLWRRRARIGVQVVIDSYQLSHVVSSSNENVGRSYQTPDASNYGVAGEGISLLPISVFCLFSGAVRFGAPYLFFDLPLVSPRNSTSLPVCTLTASKIFLYS